MWVSYRITCCARVSPVRSVFNYYNLRLFILIYGPCQPSFASICNLLAKIVHNQRETQADCESFATSTYYTAYHENLPLGFSAKYLIIFALSGEQKGNAAEDYKRFTPYCSLRHRGATWHRNGSKRSVAGPKKSKSRSRSAVIRGIIPYSTQRARDRNSRVPSFKIFTPILLILPTHQSTRLNSISWWLSSNWNQNPNPRRQEQRAKPLHQYPHREQQSPKTRASRLQ